MCLDDLPPDARLAPIPSPDKRGLPPDVSFRATQSEEGFSFLRIAPKCDSVDIELLMTSAIFAYDSSWVLASRGPSVCETAPLDVPY